MFFGIVGCPPKDDPASKATTSSVVTKPNVDGNELPIARYWQQTLGYGKAVIFICCTYS